MRPHVNGNQREKRGLGSGFESRNVRIQIQPPKKPDPTSLKTSSNLLKKQIRPNYQIFKPDPTSLKTRFDLNINILNLSKCINPTASDCIIGSKMVERYFDEIHLIYLTPKLCVQTLTTRTKTIHSLENHPEQKKITHC